MRHRLTHVFHRREQGTDVNLQEFEGCVHRYQDRVYGLACYLLRDGEEAQDVTQEVLIRLWKHRQEVEEDRLLGWLLRVTRNACIDALRKRTSYRNVMTVDTDGVARAEGDTTSPAEHVEEGDFYRRLQAALDQLNEPYRSIVILRELQELKYEEICGAMDLPLNTVKVYLHRGRKMLREQLKEVMYRETV